MQEQQRHQYLEAMGVASWLPRRHLAGAKPTPDWVWEFVYPQPSGAPTPGSGVTADASPQARSQQQRSPLAAPGVTAAAALQARAELAASFSAAPAPMPAPTEAAAETVARSATPAAATTVPPAGVEATPPEELPDLAIGAASGTEQAPFKLAFMTYDDCLVIDSLPPRSRQGVSSQHQVLAGKILQSLGLQGGAVKDLFMLPWPMFASKSLDQGAEQARSTVQHKLAKSLQGTSLRYVVLLGETAAQMILQRSEPLEQLRGLLFSLRSDVKTLATASLTEMITVPGCKRDVWLDLQPLLAHIEGAAPDA